MYPLLLVISFILHLLAFFWIILLSMRLKRSNEIETRQKEIQNEIEDLFQSYLLEMKEENEKLLNMIEKSAKTSMDNKESGKNDEQSNHFSNETRPLETYEPPVNLRSKMTQQVYQNINLNKPKISSSVEEATEYVPPVPSGDEEFEESSASQVIRLHEQGRNPTEIAKKLNMGKTEVELLLKFNGQKDN
ncbi:MAG TPA: coupling factor for flagellin transcription and translation [Bacillus bacterium]|nr:coupling factor for flagellin transcription and translation [Bacillus sp. (in: firmicutes)]